MRCLLCLPLALTLALTLTLKADDRPTVRLTATKAVEVSGLPKELHARWKAAKLSAKEWGENFRVVVAGGTEQEMLARPPLAGTYALTETGVRFEPQFPLVPGREYVAILHDDPKGKPNLTTLSLPKPPPTPRVAITGVYPSADRLPENTLRLYVHFSGEVARGGVYRHFTLVRDDGVEVKEPLLEVEEELWSESGTRLTILFHPGRVKRGLVPREQEGPILEEGRTYTLTISGRWEDIEGRPIVAPFKKTFAAGPPDDNPVDPDQWALLPPRAGSNAPLLIRLHKPLDHAMLGRVIWVADASGNQVPGTITVGGGERVVTFAPKNAWTRGEYKLVTDTQLEDVCGNRVGEPFEVDVFKPITRKIETKTHERPFTVR